MTPILLAPRVALPLLALVVVACGFLERPLNRGAALVYRALVAWATRGALWSSIRATRTHARLQRRPIPLMTERTRRHPPLVVVHGRSYRVSRPWLARVLLRAQRRD